MVRSIYAGALWALAGSLLAAEFTGGVGGTWEFAARGQQCTLQQPLGDYGVARFSGVRGEGLHFELLGHRELFGDGAVELLRVAPPWHAQFPAEQVLGKLNHLGGSGVRVAEPVATQILMALFDGFDARLQTGSWYAGSGSTVAVQVSSVGFRALYEDFIHCAQGSPVMGWAEVEKTRISYPTNGWQLTPQTTAKLQRVARFAARDSWLTGVYVDGHTDSLGTQRGNYRLSKQRAEAVQACLIEAGVKPELLTVRFHGAAYPVADNETDAGRARNRRTTVRLERTWPQLEKPAANAELARAELP